MPGLSDTSSHSKAMHLSPCTLCKERKACTSTYESHRGPQVLTREADACGRLQNHGTVAMTMAVEGANHCLSSCPARPQSVSGVLIQILVVVEDCHIVPCISAWTATHFSAASGLTYVQIYVSPVLSHSRYSIYVS